jgi:hypothetical protein
MPDNTKRRRSANDRARSHAFNIAKALGISKKDVPALLGLEPTLLTIPVPAGPDFHVTTPDFAEWTARGYLRVLMPTRSSNSL